MADAATLSPERIVDVASSFISERGLTDFSMRKLAAALDVTPMTLYLRFDNKEALLAEVASRNLRSIRFSASGEAPWDERLVGFAADVRSHLVTDRNLLQLYARSRQVSPTMLAAVDTGLGLMEEIGLRNDEAVAAFRAIFWHAVGSALVVAALGDLPANHGDLVAEALTSADAPDRANRFGSNFGPVDADDQFIYATQCLVRGIAHLAEMAIREDLR